MTDDALVQARVWIEAAADGSWLLLLQMRKGLRVGDPITWSKHSTEHNAQAARSALLDGLHVPTN